MQRAGNDPEANELLVPVAVGLALQLPPEVGELVVHELGHGLDFGLRLAQSLPEGVQDVGDRG